jgi:hypothetical protein
VGKKARRKDFKKTIPALKKKGPGPDEKTPPASSEKPSLTGSEKA